MLPVRMPRRALACALLLCALAWTCGCAHAPANVSSTDNIGHALNPADVAPLDLDVSPDGSGLPNGRGDAVDGAAIFAASCQRCHGEAIRLDQKRWPYATTLFDYIRRAMPPARTAQLSAHDVYALTAYELYANGISARADIIDRTSLPRVQMPGVADFIKQP